jgi:hypothetical protein
MRLSGDFIQCLVELLSSSHHKVQLQAAAALGSLAWDSNYKQKVMQAHGLVTPLMELVDREACMAGLGAAAAPASAGMSPRPGGEATRASNSSSSPCHMAPPASPVASLYGMDATMLSSPLTVRGWAADTLCQLTIGQLGAAVMGQQPGVQFWVSHLSSSSTRVRQAAATALANLAAVGQIAATALKTPGRWPPSGGTLRRTRQKGSAAGATADLA